MDRKSAYDVLVAGGGPAGVSAAIAAARCGASVLLLERYGFLGGMGTAALVSPFMAYETEGVVLTRGIFKEVTARMAAMGGFCEDSKAFDAEALKFVLNEMCMENGVNIRFHVFAYGVKRRTSQLEAVEYLGKGGRHISAASVFIDATGDADIVALCGCDIWMGRNSDGRCQPSTLMFRVGGVALPEGTRGVEFAVPVEERLPQGRVLYFSLPHSGEAMLNMTRVTDFNPLDTDDLTRAEIEARRQVYPIIRYMREKVPGFQNAYLLETAPQIGIRESRRVVGEYLLDREHIFSYRKSADDIAYGMYKIDIHNPAGQGTEIRELAPGQYYGIPYRCLIPRGMKNLLAAGRCISATHEGLSSTRIMPVCYALGEAAGVAAALAAAGHGGQVRLVDPQQIRNRLELPARN
jgi:hypothetical protein